MNARTKVNLVALTKPGFPEEIDGKLGKLEAVDDHCDRPYRLATIVFAACAFSSRVFSFEGVEFQCRQVEDESPTDLPVHFEVTGSPESPTRLTFLTAFRSEVASSSSTFP
jgi:hypothetical protein